MKTLVQEKYSFKWFLCFLRLSNFPFKKKEQKKTHKIPVYDLKFNTTLRRYKDVSWILSEWGTWVGLMSGFQVLKISSFRSSFQRVLFSFSRWETVPLWLGRLWVEVRPLRWTDQALSQTHGAPPLPVPEVRPGILEVGPPRLAYEEALLNPQTVDVTHTARREFSIFHLSHCLPGEGRKPAGKHYSHGQVPNKSPCEWIIRRHKETKRQTQKKNKTDGVCDWIFYHSNSKSNLNIYIPGLTKRQGGDWKLWISGYKLDLRVGGREDQNPLRIVLMQYKHKDHLVFCLPSKSHYDDLRRRGRNSGTENGV